VEAYPRSEGLRSSHLPERRGCGVMLAFKRSASQTQEEEGKEKEEREVKVMQYSHEER